MKALVLGDEASMTNDESELADKKWNRIIVVAYSAFFAYNCASVVIFPILFSQNEFVMPVYAKLPFVE